MIARPLAALCLALLIMLTTGAMAVARAGMAVGGTITICVGTTSVELPVGPDGRPLRHGHICPDCTIGALAPAAALPPATAPTRVTTLAFRIAATRAISSPEPAPGARDPPVRA